MVTLFEIIVNIIEEGIVFIFLMLYLGNKYKGFKSVIGFLLFHSTSVITLTYMNSITLSEGLWALVFTAIYFGYAYFFLAGDIYSKLFIAQFLNCMVYFVAIMSGVCISILTEWTNEQIYQMGIGRVVSIIISKLILVLVCLCVLKLKKRRIPGESYIKILFVVPVVTEIAMLIVLEMFLTNGRLENDILLLTICVLFTNTLTYFVFVKSNQDLRAEAEMRIMRQKYDNDRKHSTEIEELYSKTCGLRHDLLNHLEIISKLIQREPAKAIEYIKNVADNQIGEMICFIKTDNECFNAIANTKIDTCNKNAIKVQIRVKNGSLSRLKNDEIGIIFGNLFDNAIEAAKKTEEKRIELDVQTQGQRCSILMINSISETILENNVNLTTSKNNKESHRYGIKNIKKIVDSYEGMISFFEEDKYFCCDILI